MSQILSTEQKQAARHTDLYAFLKKYHGSDFKQEGSNIRPKSNHSISIHRGYHGYKDFSTGETGNSVDFLTRHMGYTFVQAVQALAGGHGSPRPACARAAGCSKTCPAGIPGPCGREAQEPLRIPCQPRHIRRDHPHAAQPGCHLPGKKME